MDRDGSPIFLGHEARRVILEELSLSYQLLQQLHVALRVQLQVQRHGYTQDENTHKVRLTPDTQKQGLRVHTTVVHRVHAVY